MEDDLHSALNSAFPTQPITRAALDEPANGWANYDRGAALVERVAGKTWRDLDAQLVEEFHEGLIYAGPSAFGAMLPAYLAFLVDHDRFSDALYVVANQLTRKDDPVSQRTFDARIATLDVQQRAAVAKIVNTLAARPAMERAMSAARASWTTTLGGAG